MTFIYKCQHFEIIRHLYCKTGLSALNVSKHRIYVISLISKHYRNRILSKSYLIVIAHLLLYSHTIIIVPNPLSAVKAKFRYRGVVLRREIQHFRLDLL